MKNRCQTLQRAKFDMQSQCACMFRFSHAFRVAGRAHQLSRMLYNNKYFWKEQHAYTQAGGTFAGLAASDIFYCIIMQYSQYVFGSVEGEQAKRLTQHGNRQFLECIDDL